jgi:excisionase family DNA binding protein
MTKKWLTIKDAAAYLGVSKDFIRALIDDGLPCYKVRHTIFVSQKEIDETISRCKI